MPGLSPAFRSINHDSVSVELQYMHDYAGITAGMGFPLCLQTTIRLYE